MKTYTHALEDLDAGKLPQWEALPVRPASPMRLQCLQHGMLHQTACDEL